MALIATNTSIAEVHLQFSFVGVTDQKIIPVARVSLLDLTVLNKVESHIVLIILTTIFVYLLGTFRDDKLKLLAL